MIRVTFRNEKQYEYIYCCFTPHQIGLTNMFNQTEYYPYGSIKKVEKQVKELTLEELSKLQYTLIYDNDVVGIMPIDSEDIKDMILIDDYIDITDLVKEQGV